MTKFEQMDLLLSKNNGIITTADIVKAGISKPYFAEYSKKRGLERVSHGVYISKDAWYDPFYLLQLRFGQAVFSHDTALYLHDLSDREPTKLTISVKTGYNTSHFQELNIKSYTIKTDLYDLGLITMDSPFSNPVKVYNMERTICDIVRSRSSIEIQTFQSALSQFVRKKDRNLPLLMEYAKTFRIEKILKQYLEVLLT